MASSRTTWTDLADEVLLSQCEVDTYRASGPGGQKRNKTSSAVRLRHPPTGLLVIAEESRSQHENKARALRRLRQTLYLQLREPISLEEERSASSLLEESRDGSGRLLPGQKDSRYWPLVGLVLDVLEASSARVADSARCLGLSTGHLVAFLQSHPRVWEQANRMRSRFGHRPLR
jgi:hypothetical protein